MRESQWLHKNRADVGAAAEPAGENKSWALEFRDVTKCYRDFCLGPISLALPSGCIIGLAGENGAGKTTLIKTALGMVSTESGEIRCLGRDIRKAGREIRRRTGAVFGEIELPGTFTAKNAAKLWEKIYEDFDRERFGELSAQLRIPQEKKLQSYSAGTKVKLAIAGALSHRASLLLLDEPLNGLDPVSREEVLELIREFAADEEHTVLISSHILADLDKISDYLVMLSDGKVVLYEEKDALLERYAAVKGSWEDISSLEQKKVRLLGTRRGSFGTWALLDRESVKGREGLLGESVVTEPASLEEIVVCLMKEEERRERGNRDEGTAL